MQVIRLYNETGKHVLSITPCNTDEGNYDYVNPDTHEVVSCEHPMPDGSTVADCLFRYMQEKHSECIKDPDVTPSVPELPRYEHDCTSCKFLGRFKNADLYFHPGPVEVTVIARTGSQGEYYSGLIFGLADTCLDSNSGCLLREALCRALKVVEYRKSIVECVDKYHHDRWPVLGSLIREIDLGGV